MSKPVEGKLSQGARGGEGGPSVPWTAGGGDGEVQKVSVFLPAFFLLGSVLPEIFWVG